MQQFPLVRMAALALLAASPLYPVGDAPAQASSRSVQIPPELQTPWKDEKRLRVCADPDNMPASNQQLQGFDNKIAALIARELGDSVSYFWWPSRRGYLRNTINAKECDVVMDVPADYDPVATTKPYYRSTYYLVYRKDRGLDIKSLDDPRLKRLKIGVNLLGEEYTNTPPAHALSARGLISNVVGFSSFYGDEHQPGEIIDSLAAGKIDVAVVWGPLAGYFASRSKVPMTLVPLPDKDSPDLPFAYSMAIGTRHQDRELKDRLDEILTQRKAEIDRILLEYNVPTLTETATTSERP
jgi:quinoprotein dehydrogenase-associated probable ABC transporter substrate-binding protein